MDELLSQLCEAFASLKTPEEHHRFLLDIATPAEIESFKRRLEAAKQLKDGTSYRDVHNNTGLSTATVTRVARFLKGSSAGYELVLKRLSNKQGQP